MFPVPSDTTLDGMLRSCGFYLSKEGRCCAMCLIPIHAMIQGVSFPFGVLSLLTSACTSVLRGAGGPAAGSERQEAGGAAEPECVGGEGSPPPWQGRASWQRPRNLQTSGRSDELRAGKMGPWHRRARLFEATAWSIAL